MKALRWYGARDVRVETVPDPEIVNPRDAIVKVTRTAICGSDLHVYNGDIPTMQPGDILGHEFMGEVVDVGRDNHVLARGDRVVVPFAIACGRCDFCRRELTSLCDNSNPGAAMAETLYGFSPAGLFGHSHLMGGYAGGQAEYVRVPFADVGPLKIPDGMSDEQVLFLSDVLPTGYMAAENCAIHPGDTIAVWGCGAVGQFAIKAAYLLGAERVIAIDRIPERLLLAETQGKAETLNDDDVDVPDELRERTAGRGPDACIDAVGTDRPHALRQAIHACRKGGVVSIPGVYGGLIDKMPLGAAFQKGLAFKMGQTNVHRYMRPLLGLIQRGAIDPTFVITHRLNLDDAPHGYEIFDGKQDRCIKVVLTPWDHRPEEA